MTPDPAVSITSQLHGEKSGLGNRRSLVQVLRWLAAPQLTVLVFVLAAVSALWISEAGAPPTLVFTPPLLLLTVNLAAALLIHPRFRTDLPLLLFHIALIMLVILFFIARMTYLEGLATVTRGATFNGELLRVEKGPWHGEGYHNLRFVNEGFIDEYPANGNGYLTFNTVHWRDVAGNLHRRVIGDDVPLVLKGYRFYATRRGFTPRLFWQPQSGDMQYIDVKLPDIGPDGWHEGFVWTLPGGQQAQLMVEHKLIEPPPGSRRVDLGLSQIDAPLIVRTNEQRHVLRPGRSLELAGGTLSYVKLDVWLGYEVVYDPTTPWLIAVTVIGIVSLIVFYLKRVFIQSTQEQVG